MIVTLVPREHLPQAWPLAFPFIDKALEAAHRRDSAEKIVADLIEGRLTLWMAFDENKEPIAAVVVRITLTASDKLLVIEYVGGRGNWVWIPKVLEVLESYGTSVGCSYIETVGIPKWEAMSKRLGMTEIARVYRKKL